MQMGDGYRVEPTPAAGPAQPGEGKPRARKRPRGAPTHVRSWPLRPDPARCRVIRTRFFTGTRVYNAVLAEFIGCSRAVKSDPAWQAARQLPRRTKSNGPPDGRRSMPWWQPMVFPPVRCSRLRRRCANPGCEHLPAQETQNLGARAFDAVKCWHVGRNGKPRFKSTKRGLHSVAAKDGHGALRPTTDAAGRLVGLQWGAGFVVAIAPPASSGRRGKEQRASWPRLRR
ncbi:MAG TPA: hypothetical protein VLZ05_13025 [Mycobacterium sp.]|nr:hypothetical protein [Mycobacterium sp.]HUH69701.1 hypothetical protein [Mycobacterium sp.]